MLLDLPHGFWRALSAVPMGDGDNSESASGAVAGTTGTAGAVAYLGQSHIDYGHYQRYSRLVLR